MFCVNEKVKQQQNWARCIYMTILMMSNYRSTMSWDWSVVCEPFSKWDPFYPIQLRTIEWQIMSMHSLSQLSNSNNDITLATTRTWSSHMSNHFPFCPLTTRREKHVLKWALHPARDTQLNPDEVLYSVKICK